jgi:adenylosuccinate synthase
MKILTLDLGWGDSGKGKVVDWIAGAFTDNAIVVRYSGGSNCGHNVFQKDNDRCVIHHEFTTICSGSFHACPTFLDEGVYWNPVRFLNEYDVLEPKVKQYYGSMIRPEITVYAHPESPLITYQEVNASRVGKEMADGTCGQGVFRTILREREHYHLRAKDIEDLYLFNEKAEAIYENYYKTTYDKEYGDFIPELSSKVELKLLSELEYDNYIYESNQGLLLDEHIGVMPHCTPTPILPKDRDFDECYLITRSYHTRHGNGPFNTPSTFNNVHKNEYEINGYNNFQGQFRTSYLDINRLKYSLKNIPKNISKKFNLVINCLDIESETLIINQKLVKFNNKKDFVDEIIKNVNEIISLDKIYLSDSPFSSSILEYEEFLEKCVFGRYQVSDTCRANKEED